MITARMGEPRGSAGGWVGRLRRRWGVGTGRVFLILLAFACTGITVMLLKRPVVTLVAGDGPQPVVLGVAYYVLILPIYNLLLLAYGALLGQFRFFWEFERRMLARLGSGWRRGRDRSRAPAPDR